jgi:hypothetical protein
MGFQPIPFTSSILVFSPIALKAITINSLDRKKMAVTAGSGRIHVLFMVTMTKKSRINQGKMEATFTLCSPLAAGAERSLRLAWMYEVGGKHCAFAPAT